MPYMLNMSRVLYLRKNLEMIPAIGGAFTNILLSTRHWDGAFFMYCIN